MKPLNHCMTAISLLYVEDDPGTRETISSVIRAKFPTITVRTAENGRDGVRSFQEQPAEIVLTDISMPVMNGIQMARQIRELDYGVYIIAATAFSDSHYLMDAINAGIGRYLLKPIDFKLLFEAIDDRLVQITAHRRVISQNDEIRKLSRIVEQSPSMVLISDATGTVEYVNPRFTQLTGYALQEIIGQSLLFLMTHASPVDIFQRIWTMITNGGQWRGEIFNRKKNGELYCEEISISSLLGEQGEITNFVLVMEDISKCKQAQDAARESEFLIEQSQLASSIGSYKTFFSSGRWESSTALDRILGIDQSFTRDLPGFLEIIHPTDRDGTWQYLRERFEARRGSFNKEFTIIRKSDGVTRKVSGLGKAGYDHEGNIVSVIGTIRDITELRDATGKPKLPGELPLKKSGGAGSGCYGSKDRELTKHKRLEEALSESEQCFSALCDHAPIGIFRTDWEGNNIYSNAIWEEITGQSAAAAKGKGWLNAIHPDDGDRFGKAWFKAMVTGRPYSLEHRIITPQGETVWVRSGASNIKGANGQIRGFVGTVENLSTLKQTALQLAPTVSAPDLLAVQTPPIAAKNDSVSFSLSESP